MKEDYFVGVPFKMALIRPKPADDSPLVFKKAPHHGFAYSFPSLDAVYKDCKGCEESEDKSKCFNGTISVTEGNSLIVYSDFSVDLRTVIEFEGKLSTYKNEMICDFAKMFVEEDFAIDDNYLSSAVESWNEIVKKPLKDHPVLNSIKRGLRLLKGRLDKKKIKKYIFSPASVSEAVAGDVLLYSMLAPKFNIWQIPVLLIKDDKWTLLTQIVDVESVKFANISKIPDDIKKLYFVGGVFSVICPPYMVAQTGITGTCNQLFDMILKKAKEASDKAKAVFSYTFFLRLEEDKKSADTVFIYSCMKLNEVMRSVESSKAQKVIEFIKENSI